ncbi:MAG: SRPBCC family protein [Ilumatobacteraceae bacterium]
MTPTAALEDDGSTLALTRRFASPIEDVWASITESDRLARWFGTWTGDPSTGWVTVTMNAEAEPVPASRYDIRECEPPRVLAVSAIDDAGTWHLRAELSESDGITTLVFRHEWIDPEHLASAGVGWEWYLDRLAAAVVGETPPSLEDFDTRYLPAVSTYTDSLS